MTNSAFVDRAFRERGPKLIFGFSRPLYHNLAGVLYGRRFIKGRHGGMIRHTEAAMLYQWARQLRPHSTIVEIGCYAGLSTSYLACGCLENGSMVYAIDPFDSNLPQQTALCDLSVSLEDKPSRQFVAERLKSCGLADHVELIEGFAEEVVRTWTRRIDFLWIDGNHNRAYEDYLEWSPFLKARARVAIHAAHPRYGLPQVAEAARRIFSSEEWGQLEHVKGIMTGVRKADPLKC
jgi:predicted O-methyltransferase YrrM